MEKVGAYTDRVTESGEWRPGNPASGQQATPMLAGYFNMMQRELVAVVEAAGLALDVEDDTQLLKAFRALTDGAVLSFSESVVLPAKPGLFLLSAGGGARTFYLPPSDSVGGASDGIEVVVRRSDASANVLVLAVSGDDKLMLDTTANAAGQTTTELLFAGDYLRLRSDGAGKWWCVGQAQLPASIATGFVKWDVAGVYTFTVPAVLRAGRRRALSKATGAGGAGSRINTSSGGGGGAGATGFKVLDLIGVTSLPITVGAGGAPAASGVNGNNGGATSIGALMTANGGSGSTSAGQGGNGSGNAPGADFVIPGSGGENRGYFLTESSSSYYTAGGGGGSYWAGGARAHGVATPSAGFDGAVGGGGSGSTGSNPAGRGGDGVVTIEW
ncbi:hypothetical protein L1F06_004900 [Ectopseudomonas hydrolytica]|uniref:Glycine-rich domain-containing protein n=1 Tax=Ectopseudomonas hydrolytica TaxID=2493633 RepID=A0ABY5ABK8_9GAMM|nr:hypothetical protein [Pseudomonas hydrolytica]USR40786.1 hypothetical protein L1F06_004900 [Pseudomonas hydrolytica]